MRSDLAYKLEPAGHDAGDSKRKYEKPDDKLAKIFEEWLKIDFDDDDNRRYETAELALLKLKPTARQANALILHYQDHPGIRRAGPFITAAYNKSKEKIVFYDIDIGLHREINSVGYNLAKDKILISTGKTGRWFGRDSRGKIINYGTTSYFAGGQGNTFLNYGTAAQTCGEVSLLAINMGTVGDMFFDDGKGIGINFGNAEDEFGKGLRNDGIIVNAGKAGSDFGSEASGIAIDIGKAESYNFEQCHLGLNREETDKMPQLKQYFDRMRAEFEKGRTDYKMALKALKTYTQKTIEDNILHILKEGGHGY